MKSLAPFLLSIALLIVSAGAWGVTASDDGIFDELWYDELSGAWRSEEGPEMYILLLYPGNAYRFHYYSEAEGITQMAEGARAMDGEFMYVTDIRLGFLDADGNYTETGSLEEMTLKYELDLSGDIAALTLYDEFGETYVLYPFNMDGPPDEGPDEA